MATDRLRAAVAGDESVDRAATFLAEKLEAADLNLLVSALDEGDPVRIAEALDTDVDTLFMVFDDLRGRSVAYAQEFPEFSEWKRRGFS